MRDFLAGLWDWYSDTAGGCWLAVWPRMVEVAETDGPHSPELGRRLVSWLVAILLLGFGAGLFWLAWDRDTRWPFKIMLGLLGAYCLLQGLWLTVRGLRRPPTRR